MNFKRTHPGSHHYGSFVCRLAKRVGKRTLLTNAVVHTVSANSHARFRPFGWRHNRRRPGGENAPVQKSRHNQSGTSTFSRESSPQPLPCLMEIAAVRATVDTSEVGTYTQR